MIVRLDFEYGFWCSCNASVLLLASRQGVSADSFAGVAGISEQIPISHLPSFKAGTQTTVPEDGSIVCGPIPPRRNVCEQQLRIHNALNIQRKETLSIPIEFPVRSSRGLYQDMCAVNATNGT